MTEAVRAVRATLRATPPPWFADRQAARLLRYAAAFYAIAWAVHSGDHIRRGLDVETAQVATLGSIAAVAQLLIVATVFVRWRWAALAAAAIGFPDAVGIAAVHLLPHWSAFSDAFPGSRGTGVTGFSWFAAVLEIVGALLFAVAGVHAMRVATRQRHDAGAAATPA